VLYQICDDALWPTIEQEVFLHSMLDFLHSWDASPTERYYTYWPRVYNMWFAHFSERKVIFGPGNEHRVLDEEEDKILNLAILTRKKV
jgi:hypothetical protein